MVQRLGFLIQGMNQHKKGVRIHIRTSSFGFTLVEMVITMMLNAMVMTAFFQITYTMPLVIEDTFTKDKIFIRSYENLACVEGLLFHDGGPLDVLCTENATLIKIHLQEKVFYAKK